ncbi:MAG: carbohydrate ABC transporter permease [Chloroflexota bacterium]|nr:carbohydrate ABC transporter permease [Chloroflexota bacterium]
MGVLSPAPAEPRVAARPPGRVLRARLEDGLFWATLLLVLAVFLFPVFYMAVSAFKPGSLAMAYPSVWTFRPSLEHFTRVLGQQQLAPQLWNSLLIALGAVGLGLVLGLPAAYSIARYRQERLATWLLVVRMVPYFGALIPMYVIFREVGLTNSILGLILSHLVITVPLTTWIMIGFIEDVPRELEEAALMDGASRLRAFFYVALPLVTPGMVAAAVLNFIFSWNNFQMALILGGNETKTAPVAVLQYIGSEAMDWGGMMAAATLVSLPTFLFVLLVQKYLVQGLTAGGLKG